MDYKDLADLIFPDEKQIEYYEEKGLLYKVKLHANVNITEEMISEWLKNYNENR